MGAGLRDFFGVTGGPSRLVDRRHVAGVGRMWAFTGGMVAVAGVVHLAVSRHLDGVDSPARLPWWALAGLFYLAEANVVRVHFRREAQEFSLSQIPLVLGLFLASPDTLLAALLIGSPVALALHRRQSRLQIAFNVSHFLLSTVVALLVVDRIVVSDPLGPEGWFGAILATVMATLIGHAAITVATLLSGGRPDADRLPRVLALGFAATVTNSSLALSAVAMMWRDLRSGWLLIVPAAALVFSYKAWMAERYKHETMELIYESTRMLHRSPELDSAVSGLLDEARLIFRAERAELTLLPVHEGERALRTSLGPGDEVQSMVRVDLDPGERGWMLGQSGNQAMLHPVPARSPVLPPLAARGVEEAMVKVMRTKERVLGWMLVANRVGSESSFLPADLLLFDTLADNIGLALESGRLEQSLAQLRELENQLRYQAYHDGLTHLPNRSLFLERVEAAVLAAGSAGRIAVLFVDLDGFKTVNDGLGHTAGDQLLTTTARRVKSVAPEDALVARLGSDEFAVLLAGPDVEEVAPQVAARVIKEMSAPFVLADQEATVTASVGIAFGESGAGPEELVRNADVAMSIAKRSSGASWQVFRPEMHQAVVERQELVADMHRAMERDEFVLHFQPIIELATGRIVAFESLVRWNHPRRGLVSPADFIPVAEDIGLILPIGRAVLEKSCSQARRWAELFPSVPPLAVTVNLSARQLHQPGFVQEVIRVIADTGVDPHSLVLEITESVLLHDAEGAIAKILQLKKLGVSLAMDDFGTGYSSLSYLAQLPLDLLKVAKPFVDGLGRDQRATSFAHAIVRLGQTVQLRVIAEGIERVEQLTELRSMGCDMGQGFLFGPPADADAAEAVLAAGTAGPPRAGEDDPGEGRIIPFPA